MRDVTAYAAAYALGRLSQRIHETPDARPIHVTRGQRRQLALFIDRIEGLPRLIALDLADLYLRISKTRFDAPFHLTPRDRRALKRALPRSERRFHDVATRRGGTVYEERQFSTLALVRDLEEAGSDWEMKRVTNVNELVMTAEWTTWAKANVPDVSLDWELDRFRDWLAQTGKRQRDYAAGFRNWCRKSQEFKDADPRRKQGPRNHGHRETTAAAFLGGHRRT